MNSGSGSLSGVLCPRKTQSSRLSGCVERHLLSDREGEFADHLARMRRDKPRADDLAATANHC